MGSAMEVLKVLQVIILIDSNNSKINYFLPSLMQDGARRASSKL